MSFQYVMANIQIPIKVYENNVTEPLPEYIKINISECNELPEKMETQAIQSDFMNKIQNIISSNKEEKQDIVEMLTISSEELNNKKPKKRPHNMTFKNNIMSKRRTQKRYA